MNRGSGVESFTTGSRKDLEESPEKARHLPGFFLIEPQGDLSAER